LAGESFAALFVEEDISQSDTDYVCKSALCWVNYYEGSFSNVLHLLNY